MKSKGVTFVITPWQLKNTTIDVKIVVKLDSTRDLVLQASSNDIWWRVFTPAIMSKTLDLAKMSFK
jgi:hypothetical protein